MALGKELMVGAVLNGGVARARHVHAMPSVAFLVFGTSFFGECRDSCYRQTLRLPSAIWLPCVFYCARQSYCLPRVRGFTLGKQFDTQAN